MGIFSFLGMGGASSKLEKALGDCPDDERYYGFENFGNTCYANSVLQALYHCRPFRERVLQYASTQPKDGDETLLTCLVDLFEQINTSKKKTGVISPKRFINRLKKDNEAFRSYMHQDAHEFLIQALFAQISEQLEQQAKAGGAKPPIDTWLHDIFQGKLVNETRCLQCETVTCREEVFMDLSLEISSNCSLTSCLKQFSNTEMLDRDDKFFCDACGCLQEATKAMKIRQAPPCLVFHLKRFKIERQLNRIRKLMHRVAFPFELKLTNMTADSPERDASYSLFAVVVHVGSGLHHGHYVSLIKSRNSWLFFDDETVDIVSESTVAATFGSTQEFANLNDHGYLLFYERVQK